jgi:hypothetical protein
MKFYTEQVVLPFARCLNAVTGVRTFDDVDGKETIDVDVVIVAVVVVGDANNDDDNVGNEIIDVDSTLFALLLMLIGSSLLSLLLLLCTLFFSGSFGRIFFSFDADVASVLFKDSFRFDDVVVVATDVVVAIAAVGVPTLQ